MKKYLFSKLSSLAIVGCIAFATGIFTSCTEEIDQSNRYTFTGETVADYLENRPELFSKFTYILGRAQIGKSSSATLLKTLSTYGSYTCFAPTNEAIDSFIAQQYRKYSTTLGTEDFEDTGVHSPILEELSDSMVNEIAMNHIIEREFLTVDLPAGEIPQSNMNNRFMEIAWPVNEETGRPDIMINNTSRILVADAEVENGVVQTLESTITLSNSTVSDLLKNQTEYSVFSEALELTNLSDSVRDYVLDLNYKHEHLDAVHPGTGFTNNFKDLPYPKSKNQGYTLFVESDATLAKNNINDLNDLIDFANKWYGSDNFEGEVDYDDYTSRNNPLNRFVAYHILKSRMSYDKFVFLNYDKDAAFNPETHFGEFTYDIHEYYETLLNKMIKVTAPFKTEEVAIMVLNHTRTNNGNDDIVNVTILPDSLRNEGFNGKALNGVIHPIDKMLVYNEAEMKSSVLNERIRINSTSLFPELINNEIRWALPLPNNKMGYYIPNDYVKDITVRNSSTALYVTWPHGTSTGDWAVFQGDEFLANGVFDFEFNIPPVPAGTYEIRFGFSVSTQRGVTQFYVDGEIAGIPVDMRNLPSDVVKDIEEIEDEDIYDKGIRNQGWMRGSDNIMLTSSASMRDSENCYRRIIATKNLNGTRNHKIRFKDVTKDGGASAHENSFDYLELVPRSVLTNASKPEDKH